jgi:hypothetical protein
MTNNLFTVWVKMLFLICTGLNGAGFLWRLFEPIPGYDEITHFLTPFTLVAITAEIIYRGGGDDEFFNTPRHAVITGSDICLVGATQPLLPRRRHPHHPREPKEAPNRVR